MVQKHYPWTLRNQLAMSPPKLNMSGAHYQSAAVLVVSKTTAAPLSKGWNLYLSHDATYPECQSHGQRELHHHNTVVQKTDLLFTSDSSSPCVWYLICSLCVIRLRNYTRWLDMVFLWIPNHISQQTSCHIVQNMLISALCEHSNMK